MKHLSKAHVRQQLARFTAASMAFGGGDKRERRNWVRRNELFGD